MSTAITVSRDVGLCHLPARFQLARGGVLDGAVVAFEQQGASDAPVVVVLGGISAGRHCSAHAALPQRGWWEGLVGDGRAIDTQRFRVLSIDWLGGDGCSSAPSRGAPFPFVATADQANALRHVLDLLGIDTLHTIVGSSYGGMVGLQFAAHWPDRLRRLVAIAAPARSHPQASAWRAVQRGIVELGLAAGRAADGVALARSLAMTTYRTPEELHERFAAAPSFAGEVPHFPVQDWLAARGNAFAERWTAERFSCLCNSIDGHDVDASRIDVDTAVLGFDSDQLVPPSQLCELAATLPRLVLHREVRSRYGHDAFLKEPAAVSASLTEVLR